MSKPQAIILKRAVSYGEDVWVAKLRRTMNWGGKYSDSDERELKNIEGVDTSKTQAVWNLRSQINDMLKSAKREQQGLEWKIRMLEEMFDESRDKSNNLYKFKNDNKRNKVKTKRTTV